MGKDKEETKVVLLTKRQRKDLKERGKALKEKWAERWENKKKKQKKEEKESLLSIELEFLSGEEVKEGKGMEEITYPGVETWVNESFREQLRSVLWDLKSPGKVRIEVYKEKR